MVNRREQGITVKFISEFSIVGQQRKSKIWITLQVKTMVSKANKNDTILILNGMEEKGKKVKSLDIVE